MKTGAQPSPLARRDPGRAGSFLARLLRAGLLCATIDGIWAVVLTLYYQRTVLQLFQGIAATVFGAEMFNGGVPSALVGLALHVGVAFAWSAVFLAFAESSPWLRRVLATRSGVAAVAAVYGPLIWIVMSTVVIPLLPHRPAAVSPRWFVQLVGHFVFVGLPIAGSIGRDESRQDAGPVTDL